jgi:hypothetical protein
MPGYLYHAIILRFRACRVGRDEQHQGDEAAGGRPTLRYNRMAKMPRFPWLTFTSRGYCGSPEEAHPRWIGTQ